MDKIILEDVNKLILGTDIKILNILDITDLNEINNIRENDLCGVYVLNLKYNESYIGYSEKVKERIKSHIKESWIKNIIKNVNIFITTNKHQADDLETILISKFRPELNTQYCNNSNDEFYIRYDKLCKNWDKVNFNYWNIHNKIHDEWMYKQNNDKNWDKIKIEKIEEYQRRLKENSILYETNEINIKNELFNLIQKSNRFKKEWERDYLEIGIFENNIMRLYAVEIIYNLESHCLSDNIIDSSTSPFILFLKQKYKKLIDEINESRNNQLL